MQGPTYSRALPVQCDVCAILKSYVQQTGFWCESYCHIYLSQAILADKSTPLKCYSYLRENFKMLPALFRNFESQLTLPTGWVQQWRRSTSHFCHFCSEIWQFGGTIEPMKISSTIHEGCLTQTDSRQQRTA